MGSKVASDIFQRMLDSVYIGLPGVTGIADDMVIFGRNCRAMKGINMVFRYTTACGFIPKKIRWHIHAGSWSLVNCLVGSLYEAFYKVLMNIN